MYEKTASRVRKHGRLLTTAITVGMLSFAGAGEAGATVHHQPRRSTSPRSLLPPSIKAKGALTVGSEIDYPPMEMFAANGTTPIGADYQLGQAIGKVLGVKVTFVNNAFAGLIPGLEAGRFDMVMSAMTDNKKREKVVNFVDYFAVGSGMLVQSGNPDHIQGLLGLCGKTTVLPQATIQVTIAQQEQARCKAAGKPAIVIKQAPTPTDTYVQLESGASVASMIDYPVAAYTAKQSHGKLSLLPQQVGQVLPYGIAFRKHELGLQRAVEAAVKVLMRNGTYAKILARWGVSKGAIPLSRVVVNGARS